MYQVVSRVRHDGVVYEVGEIIHDIGEDVAQGLVEAGAIVKREADKIGHEDPAPAAAPDQPPAATADQTPPPQADQGEPANPTPLPQESGEPSVDDQIQGNVNQDLTDSEHLANTPGKPVGPSNDEVAAAAASVG